MSVDDLYVEDTSKQKLKRHKFSSEPASTSPVSSSKTTISGSTSESTSVSAEAVTSKEEAYHPTTVSLKIEEVTDDPDELIDLRGEGRYFGVTDPKKEGPICDNCHKRGHKRANCKVVICHKCGKVGDHYETHCPTTLICLRCGEKGHYVLECKSKTRKRQYCRTCDTFQHGDENCPTIWRSYITNPQSRAMDEQGESSVLPVICCYNCGSKVHYGDECPEPRSSRVPNLGSAFSGNNLPKRLRPLYFLGLKRDSGYDEYDPLRSRHDYDTYDSYEAHKRPSRGFYSSNGGDLSRTSGMNLGGHSINQAPSHHSSGYYSNSNNNNNSSNNNNRNFRPNGPSLVRRNPDSLPTRPRTSGGVENRNFGGKYARDYNSTDDRRSGSLFLNGSHSFKGTNLLPKGPTRSGTIKGKKDKLLLLLLLLLGTISKPTRSGLIEGSKNKSKKNKVVFPRY